MFDGKPLRISYSDLVGCVITYLREVKGPDVGITTKAALAKKIGLTPGPYGKLESGQTVCTAPHLFRIAHALGLSASDILAEADRHVEAMKSVPGLVVVDSFESLTPKAIDDEISLKGMRVPRGSIYLFVVLGYRSWPALVVLFQSLEKVFERMENDEHLLQQLKEIVDDYGKALRWVDYAAAVNEYTENMTASGNLKEVYAHRKICSEGINQAEMAEISREFENLNILELSSSMSDSIRAAALTKRARSYLDVNTRFISVIDSKKV